MPKIFNNILFIFLLIASFAQGQEIKVTCQPKEIVVGDIISLKYSIQFNPQRYKIQITPLADTFNHFEIIERNKIDSIKQGGNLILQYGYTISNYDSGKWLIPAQEFQIINKENASLQKLKSDSIWISVHSLEVDTSKAIKPIVEIIEVKKEWWQKTVFITLAFLFLALLIFLIWYYFKHLRNKEKIIFTPVEEKKSPLNKAHEALLNLQEEKAYLYGREKEYHSQITEIIKGYIEESMQLDCFEKTSQEIITAVKKYWQQYKFKDRTQILDSLRYIFNQADFVKFAKSKPSNEEHELSLKQAIFFVTHTNLFLTQAKEEKEI